VGAAWAGTRAAEAVSHVHKEPPREAGMRQNELRERRRAESASKETCSGTGNGEAAGELE
jgi:hypothetical protein